MKKLFTILFLMFACTAFTQTTTFHLKGIVKAKASDATIVSYKWVRISGPAVTIVNPNTTETDVNGAVVGIYQFEFSATDNFGLTGRDTTQITITRDGIPPIVDAGADQNMALKIVLGIILLLGGGFLILKRK